LTPAFNVPFVPFACTGKSAQDRTDTLNAAECDAMKLLTKQAAAELVGLHPESLMRLVREGKFPQPFKITDAKNGHVRFEAADVGRWIAEKRKAAMTVAAGEETLALEA
jgi:predicted DNA-binding transcriptional regulator AlpA